MEWFNKIRGKVNENLERPVEENPLDQVIVNKGSHPEVNKVYEARWVWYHTILAVEIAFTNILLLGILIVLSVK
jgi:hypothetical protein